MERQRTGRLAGILVAIVAALGILSLVGVAVSRLLARSSASPAPGESSAAMAAPASAPDGSRDDDGDDQSGPRRSIRYALLGEVLSARDGRGVAGATVRAALEGGDVETAVTDGEGGFFFDGLPRPVRELRFSARGYDDAVVPRAELPEVPEAFWSQRLTPRAGAGAASDSAAARIQGVVVDRRGHPVTSYRLLTSRVDEPRRRRRLAGIEVDDAAGAFSLEVAPGKIAVGVAADGYRPLEPTTVDVEEGETKTLRLVVEASLEVHGRVTDRTSGAPVTGARVALVGVRGVEPVLTDGDGRFTFRSLPAENANLVVSAEGYVELNAGGVDGRRSRDQQIELELSPLRPGVAGEVVGIGVAVAGAADGVAVRVIYPGSPAEGVLQVGDIIVAVDGERLAGRGLRDSMGAIRGEAGTTIRLVVKKADGSERDVTLERRRVELPEG